MTRVMVRYLRIEQQDVATFRVYLQLCDAATMVTKVLQKAAEPDSTSKCIPDRDDDCGTQDSELNLSNRDEDNWNSFCQPANRKRRRGECRPASRVEEQRCEIPPLGPVRFAFHCDIEDTLSLQHRINMKLQLVNMACGDLSITSDVICFKGEAQTIFRSSGLNT